MIAASIQRDAFTRQTLRRVTVDNRRPPGLVWCAWCGSMPPRLYRYVWHADGATRPPQFDTRREFCNVDCWRSYDG